MKLLALIATIAIVYFYAGFLRGLLNDGHWGWLLIIGVTLPLALAWIVGNDEDRADFYKIKDWLLTKLRIR